MKKILMSIFAIVMLFGCVVGVPSLLTSCAKPADSQPADGEVSARATDYWDSSACYDTNFKNIFVENGVITVYISSAAQLGYFSYCVNNYSTYNGYYYYNANVELVADIDLSAHYWVPIGKGMYGETDQHPGYCGKFNGNFHTISGLTITIGSTANGYANYAFYEATSIGSNTYCMGLFGYLNPSTSGIQVKNLILKDVQLKITSMSIGGAVYIGSVAAMTSSMSVIGQIGVIGNSIIQDWNSSTAGIRHTGGLVGNASGAIYESFVDGMKLSGSSTVQDVDLSNPDNWCAGGIVGSLIVNNISDSYFIGGITLYGYHCVGGIAGFSSGSLTSNYAYLNTTTSYFRLGCQYAGGIVGLNYYRGNNLTGLVQGNLFSSTGYMGLYSNVNVSTTYMGGIVGSSGGSCSCTQNVWSSTARSAGYGANSGTWSSNYSFTSSTLKTHITSNNAGVFYSTYLGWFLTALGITEEVATTVDTSYIWTRIKNRQEQYPILTWYASLGRSEILHYLSNGTYSTTPNKKLYIQEEWVKYCMGSSISHSYNVSTDEHTVTITPAEDYEIIGVPVYIPDFNKSYKISFTYTSTAATGDLRFRIYTTPPKNGWYNGTSEQIYGYKSLTGSQTNASISYILYSSTLLGKASYISNNTIYICFNGGALSDGQGDITYTIKNFQVTLNDGLTTTQVVQVGNPYATMSTPTKTGYTFGGWNQNIYTLDDMSVGESTASQTATLTDGLFNFEIDNSSGQTTEYGYFNNNDTSIGIYYEDQYKYVLNVESYSGTSSLIYLAYSQDSVMHADDITVASAGLYTADAQYYEEYQSGPFGTGRFNVAVGNTVSLKFRLGLFDITSPSTPTTTTIVPDCNNLLLYGEFTPNNYTVTFNSYGGTFSTTQSTGLTYVSSTSVTKSVTYDTAIGTLPTLNSRTGYTFAGWYTSTSYTTQVTTSTILSSTGATYYAKWTPQSVTRYIRVAFCDDITSNTYTVNSAWNSSSVKISYYSGQTMSGSTAAYYTSTCSANTTLYVRKSSTMSLSSITAPTGYVCVGVKTSTSALTSFTATYSRASSLASTSVSAGTSSTQYVYLAFKKASDNLLKYDSYDKYFYFEDGLFPQTAVVTLTNGTTLNSTLNSQSYTTIAMKNLQLYGSGDNSATLMPEIAAGTIIEDESQYTLPKDGSVLRLVDYGGYRYAGVMLDSAKTLQLRSSTGTLTSYTFAADTIYWFRFDPIRWRVSDYGVSSTAYPSSFSTYASGKTNFVVSTDVLWYSNLDFNNDLTSGSYAYSLDVATLFRSSSFNTAFFGADYAGTTYTTNLGLKYDEFGTSESNDKVLEDKATLSTRRLQIAATDDSSFVTDTRSYGSHLTCLLMGIDQDEYAEYWTRDFGQTIGNGKYVNKSGEIITSSSYYANDKGIRFTIYMTEGSRA